MPRREEYQGAARAIAVYLAERQRPDGSFPGPDHYGVASALWLWSHFGVDFARQLDRAWNRLKSDPPPTHGELNIYALLHCRQRLGEGAVDALIRRLRPGGRHSANWMLLRAVCHASQGPCLSPSRAQLEGRTALVWHSRRGFVEDRPGVKSFTYHAFCGALLADLWRLQGFPWAGRAAAQAAALLAPFVMPNGDALYVGRGQQQIFGYGALIYLLEAASAMTGEAQHAQLAHRVFRRAMTFQRRDGSFPLVLREGEEPEPWRPDATRPGWLSYNRYADYLPFLGCMLLKACLPAGWQAAGAAAPSLGEVQPAQAHRDFRVIGMSRYAAVFGVPGGPPTNDLCFPYVCFDGRSIFPCYGREGERVEPWEASLPYGVTPDRASFGFRDHLRYRLTETGLIGASSLVRHERTFAFREDGFECTDEITFQRRCSWSSFVPANFLFRALRREGGEHETWHGQAQAHIAMDPQGVIVPNAAVTASGRLVALRRTIDGFTAEPGQRLSVRLAVEFLEPTGSTS